MYGVSSLPINHPDWFRQTDGGGEPQWSVMFEREYDLEVPEGADLRSVGTQILKDAGMEGSFNVGRPGPGRIAVHRLDFLTPRRLTYFVDEGRLVAEARRFQWGQFLVGMHVRGGFRQDSILADAWAVIVDLVCVAMLIWIASGIYMWWLIRKTRLWGAVALGGGLLSFLFFLWAL
jgi:hypothetical protein